MITLKKLQLVREIIYKNGCLLDNVYSKSFYKMITIDLSKQQAFDTDPKAIEQINFTGNLEFVINEEAKKNYFEIFLRNREI